VLVEPSPRPAEHHHRGTAALAGRGKKQRCDESVADDRPTLERSRHLASPRVLVPERSRRAHLLSLQTISQLTTFPGAGGEPWPTGALLAIAARLIEQAWNRRLAGLGISPAGTSVLIALEEGALSQTQLAGLCRVTAQTMSRTLDRLQRDGLIRREPHPTDRRRSHVRRTAQGTKTLRAALHGRPRGESVFERLDDPDRFRADLLRLIEALERADAPSERPGPAS